MDLSSAKQIHPLLSVVGLKKYFPITAGIWRHQVGCVKAVDGIDFFINPGEVLGMVGESGCGKSTAARSAIRLIEPTEGHINFLGQDFRALNQQQLQQTRKKVQIVFQDPYASLNPRKTIKESVGEALLYHNLVKDRIQQHERVEEVLDLVGISKESMNRYPHEFSGGQQQRICIARALALNPTLLVCDEAVSALDISVQAQILNLLIELKETLGLSYLFISHDLSVVRHICDRVLVLYAGKIVEEASVNELFEHPKHPYTKALLSAIPRRHPLALKKLYN